jgi:hypothetical protein
MKKLLTLLSLALIIITLVACTKPQVVEESAESHEGMSWESVEEVSKAEISVDASMEESVEVAISKPKANDAPVGSGGVNIHNPNKTESEIVSAIADGDNLKNHFGVVIYLDRKFCSDDKIWTEDDFPGIKIKEFRFSKIFQTIDMGFDISNFEEARQEVEKLIKFDFIKSIV